MFFLIHNFSVERTYDNEDPADRDSQHANNRCLGKTGLSCVAQRAKHWERQCPHCHKIIFFTLSPKTQKKKSVISLFYWLKLMFSCSIEKLRYLSLNFSVESLHDGISIGQRPTLQLLSFTINR
jgi:hypothetical protein